MFQVTFQSDVHGIIEEIVDYGHVDAATVPDMSRYAAEEWRKAPYRQNEEHGSDINGDNIPEEVTPAKIFSLKELSDTSQHGKHKGNGSPAPCWNVAVLRRRRKDAGRVW